MSTPSGASPSADPQNPYLGLNPFCEGDASFFFGRKRETDDLMQLVRRETLTVLYGVSGLGKTSLLNAGLSPRLREEGYLPIPVRLDFNRETRLVEQVFQCVRFAAKAREVEFEEPEPEETLWSFFHRVPFWGSLNRLLVPVLIFDQFEELFTLAARSPVIEPFLVELADLVENHVPVRVRELGEKARLPPTYEKPKVKVILALREDYLARLDDLRTQMPSLMLNRYRVRRMDGRQAFEAVFRPGQDIIDAEVADAVVRFVAAKAQVRAQDDLELLEVEPSLLSLVCHELNVRRKQRGLPRITADLLSGESSRVLSDFYERAVEDLDPAVRDFLELKLLTQDGYRTTVALTDACNAPGMSKETIALLIDRRLLRLEDRLDIPHVELVHDVLTHVLRRNREFRQQRMNIQESYRKRLFWARVAAVLVLATAIVVFVVQSALVANRVRQEQRQEAARTAAGLLTNEARNQLAAGNVTSASTLLGLAWSSAEEAGDRPSDLAVTVARAAKRFEGQHALQEGHTGEISLLRFSRDGSRLVTAGIDGVALVWSAKGEMLGRFEPWKARVFPAEEGEFLARTQLPKMEDGGPPGRDLLTAAPEPMTASLDETGRYLVTVGLTSRRGIVWDVDRHQPLQFFTARFQPTNAGFRTRDSHAVIVVGGLEALQLFRLNFETSPMGFEEVSLRNGGTPPKEEVEHIKKPYMLQVHPNRISLSSVLASGRLGEWPTWRESLRDGMKSSLELNGVVGSPDGRWLATSWADGRARVWSMLDGSVRADLRHPVEVHDVAFSPDGAWLATACDDGKVRLWKVELLGTEPFVRPGLVFPHDKAVLQIEFDESSRRLVALSSSSVRIWDVTSGQVVTDIGAGAEEPIQMFVRDSRLITLFGKRWLSVWAVDSGMPLFERELMGQVDVSALDISRSGGHAAIARDSQVQLVSLAPDSPLRDRVLARGMSASMPEPLFSFEAGGERMESIRISPKGNHVVTSGWNGMAHLFDFKEGVLWARKRGGALAHGASVIQAAFNPEGTRVITTSRDRRVHVWDVATGAKLFTVGQQPAERTSRALAYSRSGWFVTGGYAGRTCLWNAASGTLRRCVQVSKEYVDAVDISPDDRLLATVSKDGHVVVWEAESGRQVRAWQDTAGNTLHAFFASSERVVVVREDGTVRVWEQEGALPETFSHGAGLRVACLLRKTERLLTVGADGVGRLWSLGGERLAELPGHDTSITDCAVEPTKERHVAIAASDGQVHVWSLDTGNRAMTITGQGSSRLVVDWSPDGRFLVTAGDGHVRLWPAFTAGAEDLARHEEMVVEALFSQDGGHLATSDQAGVVKVWSIPEGQVVAEQVTSAPQAPGFFEGAAFWTAVRGGSANRWRSLKSTTAPSLPQKLVLAAHREPDGDGTLLLQRGANWISDGKSVVPRYPAHGARIEHAEFSDDGRRLITADRGGGILVWDTQKYVREQRLTHGEGQSLRGFDVSAGAQPVIASWAGRTTVVWQRWGAAPQSLTASSVSAMALSPDGTRLLVLVDGEVRILDTTSGVAAASFQYRDVDGAGFHVERSGQYFLLFDRGATHKDPPGIHQVADGRVVTRLKRKLAPLEDAMLSPGGGQVALRDTEERASVWDARTGTLLKEFADDKVYSLAFSPDGRQLLLGGRTPKGGLLRLYDTQTWEVSREFNTRALAVHEVVFSGDGRFIAEVAPELVDGEAAQALSVWDVGSGRRVAGFPSHGSSAHSLRLSHDGARLASLHQDGTVRLYNVPAGTRSRVIGFDEVVASAYTHAGPRVATLNAERQLSVWDARSGEVLRVFRRVPEGNLKVAFDKAGTRLLVGGEDGEAFLAELGSGEPQDLRRHSDDISVVALSADGKTYLTGSRDGTVHLWMPEGKLERLRGHGGPITAAAFSPSGKLVLTGAGDGEARLWSSRGRLLDVLRGHPGAIRTAVFRPDETMAVTGGDGGWVRMWDVRQETRSAAALKQFLDGALPKNSD